MRTVIVSNRLPVVIEDTATGPRMRGGSGGLVTALSAALHRDHGRWIGWPGPFSGRKSVLRRLLVEAAETQDFSLEPVLLPEADRRGFYEGFSNGIVWPLFHDLPSRCSFEPESWRCYGRVKALFADVVAESTHVDDFIWVHDYHLMGLGRELEQRGVRSPTGFFLHIPFPPPDIFAKLPWRTDVLKSLLAYDVVGFQTRRDLDNFIDCLARLIPSAERRAAGRRLVVEHEKDRAICGDFPIGIDAAEFEKLAWSTAVEERVAQLRADIRVDQILLGVDRLDYTKGIPDRLRGYQLALRRYPELQRKVTLIQVVVPSRETVQEYADLRSQIERLVSQINGEFAEPGWTPVQYLFRNLKRDELVAYYRAADVALVTPLKDGMNLVAKEYCACQVDGNGVLILSEFAGAAAQLDVGAILINPFDVERVAESIRRAVLLPLAQRRAGMRRLRRSVRNADVFDWVDRFLRTAKFARDGRRRGRRR